MHPFGPRSWVVVCAVGVATMVAWGLVPMLVVALPTLQRDLGSSITATQWMIVLNSIAVVTFVTAAGRLSDVAGRRATFACGGAIYVVAALACALARSTWVVVAGMAVMGVGIAFMGSIGLALIKDAFPDRGLGAAYGVYFGIASALQAFGSLVGGALAQGPGWRWIFLLQIPSMAVAVAVACVAAPASRPAEAKEGRLDMPGLVVLGVGLAALTLALNEGEGWGWLSAPTLAAFASSAALCLLFVAVERRSAHALVDLELFSIKPFAGGNAILFLINFVFYAVLFFQNLHLQHGLGMAPSEAGLLFLPLTVSVAVLAPVGGRLADRIGARATILAGTACVAAGTAMLVAAGAGTSRAYLVASYLVVGIGIGVVQPVANTCAMRPVSRGQAGLAGGVVWMTTGMGIATGVAATGAILGATGSTSISMVLPLALCAPAAIAVFATIGRRSGPSAGA